MSTYRVPPSLNWLLDNRRRIAGQIQKIEGKIAKFAEKYARAKIIVDQHDVHLPRVIRSLKADLKALDQTISLHHLAVDAESIPPLREHRPKRFGNMTPTIYACFSLAPREWRTTNEVTAFVTAKRYPSIRDYEFPEYRKAVHRHLTTMLKRGRVETMSATGPRKENLWRCTNPDVVTGLVIQHGDALVDMGSSSLSYKNSLGSNRETIVTDPLETPGKLGPQNAA